MTRDKLVVRTRVQISFVREKIPVSPSSLVKVVKITHSQSFFSFDCHGGVLCGYVCTPGSILECLTKTPPPSLLFHVLYVSTLC